MKKPFISYVPHGIDSTVFFPITEDNPGIMRKTDIEGELKHDYDIMVDFKKKLLNNGEFDFIILFNNRNFSTETPIIII